MIGTKTIVNLDENSFVDEYAIWECFNFVYVWFW
jgi:hypothetical protein